MNIVMGRLIKALTYKKEGILDYFSYYYVVLVQYVPWCHLVSSRKNGYIALSYHSRQCTIFIISHHPSTPFIPHTDSVARLTTDY